MNHRATEITALLIAPDRTLADQFTKTLTGTRAFQVIGDLKTYPSEQTLDMRLRQLRPDVVLLDVASNLDAACELIRYLASLKEPVYVIGLHTAHNSDAILTTLRAGSTHFSFAPFNISIHHAAILPCPNMLQPNQHTNRR